MDAMANNLNQIIDLMLQLSKKEGHPDHVTRLHAVMIQVNMRIGVEMKKIRDEE